MRRVVILQAYVPEYRVPFFRALIASAAERGVKIVVAAGNPTGEQAKRKDSSSAQFVRPLVQKEFKVLGRRLVVRKLPGWVKSADLIIMEQARRNLDAYALLFPSLLRGRSIALWGHGRDYVSWPSRLSRKIHQLLTLRAEWFFAYTDGGAQAVADMGFPTDRITIVRNSIDASELRENLRNISPSDIATFRKALQLHDKNGLFLGGLDGSKRIDFLLESAKFIKEAEPNFRLLIVGDGAERSKVEQATRTYHWVHYLGTLAGRDKALALAASSVICMPGRVGLVAVDSFASGTPIATTDWPWHAPEYEYLVPNKTSIISKDTPIDYARAILAIFSSEHELARIEKNCCKAADDYTVEGMAERFLHGVESALRAIGRA